MMHVQPNRCVTRLFAQNPPHMTLILYEQNGYKFVGDIFTKLFLTLNSRIFTYIYISVMFVANEINKLVNTNTDINKAWISVNSPIYIREDDMPFRSISQIPQCTITYPTMHLSVKVTRAHFCYKMVHCGIWVWCIAGFMQQVYSKLTTVWGCLWTDHGH